MTADDADIAAWQTWLGGNQPDSRPSHKYDLADYGVDREALMQDFAFYSNVYVPEA